MSMKLIAKDELIKWCDEQVANGNTLSIQWEGGGDSGWCSFHINDEQVKSEDGQISDLLDLMYDQLDYGSWAGEFSAQGEAVYDPEEKAFIGVDNYSEDSVVDYPCKIEIKIPKNLWFDTLEIGVEGEDASVTVAFHVTNGFISEEHDEFIDNFEVSFRESILGVISDYCNDDNENEYRSIWETFDLSKSEFVEEGDYMKYTITSLSIGTAEVEEKDVYLELKSE